MNYLEYLARWAGLLRSQIPARAEPQARLRQEPARAIEMARQPEEARMPDRSGQDG